MIRTAFIQAGARIRGVRSFSLRRNEGAGAPYLNDYDPVPVKVNARRGSGELTLYADGTVYTFAEPVELVVGVGGASYLQWALTYTTEPGDSIAPVPQVGQRPLTKHAKVLPVAGVRAVALAGLGQVEPFEAVRSSTEAESAVRVSRKGRVLYDSGVVAAGVLINSGVLDLLAVDTLLFILNNAGAGARNLEETMYAADGATVLLGPVTLRAVAAGATETGTYGHSATGTGSTFVVGRMPPTWASYQLVAGGAGNGRVTIIGR